MTIDLSAVVEWAVALMTIGGACGLIVRAITKDVARDVSDIRHKIDNQVTRIDALEHGRGSDVTRIVKLEAAVSAIDKALERVERGQEKLNDTLNDRFDTLADAIRSK